MRSRHQLSTFTFALVLLTTADMAVGARIPTETVTCGQLVDHSLRVANNLEDCPGHGLEVAADDITIDLGGHRIDGDGINDAGIRNVGHVGVTVRNGTVTEFLFGVNFTSNAQGVITGVQAIDNSYGIVVSNSAAKSTVKGNVASANALAGIQVFGFTATVFQDNVVAGNLQIGVDINAAEGATFTKNRVVGNVQSGVRIDGPHNVLLGNVISGNGSHGVQLGFAQDNTLKRNVISGNGASGIAFADAQGGTAVEANKVFGNDDDGITIGTSAGNVLKGNVVTENGRHGISSDTNALTLTSNRADRNGFLGGGGGDDVGAGINVPAGTTNSGNKATGNDDPQECAAADLGCHVP